MTQSRHTRTGLCLSLLCGGYSEWDIGWFLECCALATSKADDGHGFRQRSPVCEPYTGTGTSWLFWGLHPTNIQGHIRTATDVTMHSNGHFTVLPHWPVTLPWYWANQSLLQPSMPRARRCKQQVLIWLGENLNSRLLTAWEVCALTDLAITPSARTIGNDPNPHTWWSLVFQWIEKLSISHKLFKLMWHVFLAQSLYSLSGLLYCVYIRTDWSIERSRHKEVPLWRLQAFPFFGVIYAFMES